MTEPTPGGLPAGRYGRERAPRSRRRTVVLLWLAGLAAVALAAWTALSDANPPVRWTDVGFVLGTDDSVEVIYEVTRPDPSVAVHCRLEALDQQFAQVGVRTVEVAPSSRPVERLRSTVQTTGPAVTGLVSTCWVP